MSRFAPLPDPPYYAVIFTAQRQGDDTDGYAEMAAKMNELAASQPGYIGREDARDATGLGIAVSYWADEAALKGWKQVAQHLLAQKMGKTRWYKHYTLRIAKVERAYSGPDGR